MGRLRTSFISAMDYTKELIKAGEEEAAAIHKAALRFNEDESQIKAKLLKEESLKVKDKKYVAYHHRCCDHRSDLLGDRHLPDQK